MEIIKLGIIDKFILVSCNKVLCKILNIEAIIPCFAILIDIEENK